MKKITSSVSMLTLMLMIALAATITRAADTDRRSRDERGEALPWLIVVVAAVGIAYFAGDAVMAFARNIVGGLGR